MSDDRNNLCNYAFIDENTEQMQLHNSTVLFLVSRSRKRFDDTVLLSLIKSFRLPVLLYGSECMDCNTSYVSYISKSCLLYTSPSPRD